MKAQWIKIGSYWSWYAKAGSKGWSVRYDIKGAKGNRHAGGNYRVYCNDKLLTAHIAFLSEAKHFAHEHFITTDSVKKEIDK